jgi:precorrin-4/cobalt-precorrin-4 C11-methyltransferase
MKVIFTGAGPGDPELLTVKARRLLESCEFCIYAGSLVAPEVIGLIPETAEKYDSAKLNLDEIMALIGQARDRSVDVIRLHTGDPSIYGAIGEQMARLDALGIEFEVVPGVSSFQAAAAALRTELTAPNGSQTITLTRIAGRTPVPDNQDLSALAETGATLCIFLSVQKISDVAAKLIPHYGDDCPACVVYRASWPDQLVIRSTLASIHEEVQAAGIKKTAMILVGAALAKCTTESLLYAASFSHEYRKGNST